MWMKDDDILFVLSGFLPPKAGGAAATGGANEVAEFAFKDQMEMMVKRGIVEECCHKPCNIFDLQNYCNWTVLSLALFSLAKLSIA